MSTYKKCKPYFVTAAVSASLVSSVITDEINDDRPISSFLGNERLTCHIDPTCRFPTEDEVRLSTKYFGNSIDYTKIRIYARGHILEPDEFPVSRSIMYVTGNSIFQGPLYNLGIKNQYDEDSVFIHEITHIWQNQTHQEYGVDYNLYNPYSYDIHDHRSFSEYGPEQQASIIQNYHDIRVEFSDLSSNDRLTRYYCSEFIATYEIKILEVLSLQDSVCFSNLSEEHQPRLRRITPQ